MESLGAGLALFVALYSAVKHPTLDKIAAKGQSLLSLDLEHCEQAEVEARLADFLDSAAYPVLGVELPSQMTWHRGRPFEAGETIADNIHGVIYRAPALLNYGRLSYPGQSVFYASWNRAPVMAELSPVAGQTIQFVMCRRRADCIVKMTAIGAYEFYFQTGRVFVQSGPLSAPLEVFFRTASEDQIRKSLYADAFLASLFRDPNPRTYRLTAQSRNLCSIRARRAVCFTRACEPSGPSI